MSKNETQLSDQESVTPLKDLLSQSDVVIFDMDGTLYLLDGDNNGFKNSSLNKIVIENTRKFIAHKEDISEGKAQQIIDEIFAQKRHLSVSLGEKYSMTKTEIFNITWDINPEGILQNYNDSQKVIKNISQTNKQLILLTSAPRIWQQKVLQYLGLTEYFNYIFCGDDHYDKCEVFPKLIDTFPNKRFLAIGDQIDTDIEPAKKLGMSGFLVNHPNDLLQLINDYE